MVYPTKAEFTPIYTHLETCLKCVFQKLLQLVIQYFQFFWQHAGIECKILLYFCAFQTMDRPLSGLSSLYLSTLHILK